MAIAAIFRYQPAARDRLTRPGNAMLASGLAVLFASYSLFGGSVVSPRFSTLQTTLAGFPLTSAGYGMLVAAALSPNSLLYRTEFRPTATLAAFA